MVSGNAKMRTEIRKAIFGDYDKVNLPDKPDVKFGLTLVSLDVVGDDEFILFISIKNHFLEFKDEEKQTLEADIWLRMVNSVVRSE